ncbi:MAG: hypothetical protein WKF75_00945 [Singulisphaera sp.]
MRSQTELGQVVNDLKKILDDDARRRGRPLRGRPWRDRRGQHGPGRRLLVRPAHVESPRSPR